ncbi:MAG: imidazoleglycerol-phosphate dehydratase HisB [Candidatus Niameybacter stercoravium]|nr:imidazoleglycerol-phosphate dehydratase HisB [Candidatus Niameybacter stercoravium]
MRRSKIERQTAETSIVLEMNLEGNGVSSIYTGIGFFDHMLTHISKHSLIDLHIEAIGDLYVDGHHTVEDIGIVFGKALKEALGDKCGIERYGDRIVPMDEALILCALDLSGGPYLALEADFRSSLVGSFDTQLVKESFRAVTVSAGMNLHIQVLKGSNDHHIIEGICKAFAKALGQAIGINARCTGIPSTKGILEE